MTGGTFGRMIAPLAGRAVRERDEPGEKAEDGGSGPDDPLDHRREDRRRDLESGGIVRPILDPAGGVRRVGTRGS
jgi:hypothetical protein